MASADLSFTKDGLIYRPDHQEEEEDDFLVEHARKDGGEPGGRTHGANCFDRAPSLADVH